MTDNLEPIRAVFRQCGLYNHAADDLLCERLAAAALDAARGEAVAWHSPRVASFSFHDSFSPVWPRSDGWYPVYAAPPAAPRVERYGEGVLVHWPEGVEQYVAVGDCVTAPSAAAVPSDTHGDEFGRGWNACRDAMLAAANKENNNG